MAIYLCPTDKKYTCSWEGPAEDILSHFEQEHDDLLYFNDTFTIDLMVPSENRLFLVDEEIYLTQTSILDSTLSLRLRYLGPQKYASKISYSIALKVEEEKTCQHHVSTSPEGALEVNLKDLEQEFPGVQQVACTLNIAKNFQNTDSDDSVFSEGVLDSPPETKRKFSFDETKLELLEDDNSVKESATTLSRSKTISFEEMKRKNVRRTKSNLSLGPIQENDDTVDCFECGAVLQPPIFLCPCGQNFCQQCQFGNCKLCDEKITFERNIDLEEKYNKYLFPCKHKKLGCPEKLIYTELRRHEANCSFCEYKCPMEECSFEGQYKAMVKHLRIIHGSTKILESFIVVFQAVPEAFLANEERGIFYCYVQYSQDSVLWEAKFCGPKERNFFCELKFKEGKLKQPLLLRRMENVYSVRMSFSELKRMKLKAKNAVLTISC